MVVVTNNANARASFDTVPIRFHPRHPQLKMGSASTLPSRLLSPRSPDLLGFATRGHLHQLAPACTNSHQLALKNFLRAAFHSLSPRSRTVEVKHSSIPFRIVAPCCSVLQRVALCSAKI